MMTMGRFKNYLKTLFPDVKFYVGTLAKKDPRCVGVYTRGSVDAHLAIGGVENTSYNTLPITILVHWTENSETCEEFAIEVYNALFGKADFTVEGTRVVSLQMLDSGPKDVSRDENNIAEMVIRLNIIYER